MIYGFGILALIGAIVLMLKLITLSTTLFGSLANFYEWLSKKINSTSLKKNAIKYNIEYRVNATVFDLQKELPKNWVKKMKLKWVDKSDFSRLKNGQSIIRIEAEERQDYNIMNGVYNYFQHTLFPTTYEVIPARVLNAISIKLSIRAITNSDKYKYLGKTFNETILEREIQADSVLLNFLDPFIELDNRGFLTGALVREIDSTAEKIRVNKLRNIFEEVIGKTTDHMLQFTDKLKGGKPAIAENEWFYSNEIHTYRFLLSKREAHMKVDGHFNRAVKAYDDGVDRLYVFGKNKDIPFTQKLIARIDKNTSFKLVEIFDLDKDYNSNKKGVGALFIR